MEYRRLGQTGLPISVLSLGTWINYYDNARTPPSVNRDILAAAHAGGINFFDGAEAYGHRMGEVEEQLGEHVHALAWSRDSYVLSGKVIIQGHGPEAGRIQKGLHRKHLIDCAQATCRRLRTDYLDLFFCHRPDPEVPLTEICQCMDDLIRRGLICYWGTSCFSVDDLLRIFRICFERRLEPPVVEQSPVSLANPGRARALRPLCDAYGLGITAFEPLERGMLTGKYVDPEADGSLRDQRHAWKVRQFDPQRQDLRGAISRALPALCNLAAEHGVSMAQIALADNLRRHPQVSTNLSGASSVEQIESNMMSCRLLEPDCDALWKNLDAVLADAMERN